MPIANIGWIQPKSIQARDPTVPRKSQHFAEIRKVTAKVFMPKI
jgi:hypothetical protein